jgi:hypothetical protein
MYLLTHSLLSSWLYAMKDSPYSDATTEKDSYAEFLQALRKEPGEQTEAMRNGVEFEDLVTDIVNGSADTGHKWYEAACKVARIVKGGQLQYKAKKEIVVSGIKILLYGRLDVLKAGDVFDIKFSKSYERGKYIDSTQHPTYLELIPEAGKFSYLVSDGNEVWTETYRQDETPDIVPIIESFIEFLKANDLWEVYTSHWAAL